MIFDHIEQMIGNTPLLKIPANVTRLKNIDIYAKMEMLNPFGSVKDRVASALLTQGLSHGSAQHKTIVESSSGNTAKALALLCGTYGLLFKTVTNRIKQHEMRQLLQILDADIEELPGLSDCPDPNDPNDPTVIAAGLVKAQPERYYYTDQYFNPENLAAHYRTTGKEILADLPQIDHYFGFLGTCGSSMGVASYLRDHGQSPNVFGVVTEPGHYIPGGRTRSELWEVGLFKKEFFTDILSCDEQQAIDGMLILNRQCGVLCGPTAGATFWTMLQHLKKIDAALPDGTPQQNAVFIVCDRLEPYMSYIQQYRPEIFAKDTQEFSRKNTRRIAQLGVEDIALADQITPAGLIQKITSGHPNLRIIDIRGNHAFTRGHIVGSINIFEEALTPLIEDGPIFGQQDDIVICCPQGTISLKYAAFLTQQGIKAASLQGGLMAWRQAGYHFVQTPQSLAA